MKNKISSIALILLILAMSFSSCDLDEKNSEIKANFSLKTDSLSSSFFTENENESLFVEAILPKEVDDSEIIWSLSTSDINGNAIDKTSAILTLSNTKVIIRMKDLRYLGDYELKATLGDKYETYHFTLNSTKSLENALVYSFVPIDTIDEESGEFVEYSISGKRLSSREERTIVGKSISYHPSSSSLLYITVKTEEFGELEISENDDFYISKTKGEGVFLQPKNDTFSSSYLSIYAGSKKKKDVSINIEKTSPISIRAPKISPEYAHEKSGAVLTITADNVSTPYYSFEGGYSLDIKVKRDINGYGKTLIFPINTKTKDEWRIDESECYITPIEFGYDVYLPFCGDYEIDAKTVSITEESETISYSFRIEENKTAPLLNLEIVPNKKIDSWLDDSLGDLNSKGYYTKHIIENARVSVPSASSGEFVLISSFLSDYIENESYENKREILEKGSTFKFMHPGTYDIYIVHENTGDKKGNFRGDEYKHSNGVFHKSFKIVKYDALESVDINGKVSLSKENYNYTFELKADNDIVKNFTIYGRLLQKKDGNYSKLKSPKGEFSPESDTILKTNKEYKVSFKINTEIETEDDVKLAIYIVPNSPLITETSMKLLPKEYNKGFSPSKATPTFEPLGDSAQDKYNARKIIINNVLDESGNYKKVSYAFEFEKDKPLIWTEESNDAKFYVYAPSVASSKLHIKATNYNNTHTENKTFNITTPRLSSIGNGELFGTYGKHGAPYKNEMMKVKINPSDKYIIYVLQCFRRDGYEFERLYLYFDTNRNKWRVHRINENNTNEYYDATIDNNWWVAKNNHQLYIYKTDQYFGVYKAKKGSFSSVTSYSYPIFEGNEDSMKYCTVHKYGNVDANIKVCNTYLELPRIPKITEWT